MSNPPFVHLHVHSQYSLLDGVSHFAPLFEQVKGMEMDTVALTDHGNLFGAFAFYKEAKKQGVKPIIGCEVYVSPTEHTDKTTPEGKTNLHMVLLSKDYQGYLNLCYLVSKGYLEGFYRKPRIDKRLLAERKEGLIALSGCMNGVLAKLIREGREKQAETEARTYSEIMGPDHFYIELMDHGLPEQKELNLKLLEIAKRTGLPVVATNDAHYIARKDAKTQDMLLAIGTGKTLDNQDRLTFDADEFYLKSPEEMVKLFGHIPGAIENTVLIAERCNSEIKTGLMLLPEYDPPDKKDTLAYLNELVDEGIIGRYGEITPALRERADYELGIISRTGFVSYFLVTWDFVHFAKDNGIAVGPGRGSGAGSLVAYALGITDLDPLANSLFFERFLNPDRVSPPDFDIDFCPLRREEVVNYVRNKYGQDNVANIITFGKMMAKAAVRDAGRVMNLPLPLVDKVAKMVPDGPKVTLKKGLEESADLKEIYNSDPQIKDLLDRAMSIEGAIRQSGMHAAGVVVSKQALIETLPLYKVAGRDEVITQYDMNEIAEIGLLKMDFLGLKNLTIIEDCIKLIKDNHSVDIDWPKIGLDDKKTFELLQRGDGFGVFQVESSGMRDMLRRALPSCFDDITALIALYRPGPMQFMDTFINRKHGREEITYLHPDMEAPLKDTYGLMVYQEQVMQVASKLAGFSLGQADILRRAMGKKKADEMRKMRQLFDEGCAKNGIGPDLAGQIFDTIMKFAEYGFNKAHAAAYAVVTYRTAYLKANYPAEYMAALLTNEVRGGASDKLGMYVGVAREMGLAVLQPDVNLSQTFFSVVQGKVRFGLAAIKNVGQGAVDSIIETREKEGPFKSFQEFCQRIDQGKINSRAIECLIKAGAFDSLPGTRPQLLAIMSDALAIGANYRSQKESGQISLFDGLGSAEEDSGYESVPLPKIPDWTDREKLDSEKELVGFFLSGHPLDRFRPDVASFSTASCAEVSEMEDGQEVELVGMITQVKQIVTKKGDQMAFMELEDFEGKSEVVVFARVYEQAREILFADAVVHVKGRISKRDTDEQAKTLADQITRIEDLRRSRTKYIDICMPITQVSTANLEGLRGLFRNHKGSLGVRIRLNCDSHGEVVIQTDGRFRINPSDGFMGDFEKLKFEKMLRFARE